MFKCTVHKAARRQVRPSGMIGAALFIMLILNTGVLCGKACAAKADPIPCMVGYSIKTMADVDSRDIEAAFRVWAQELGAQHGFHVITVLYDSTDRLVADFLAKKLDFAAITSIEFLRIAKTLNVKPEVTIWRNGKKFVKFLVLADTEDLKNGLAGLKNKKLSVLKSNAMGTMFLDTHLMKAGFSASDVFFSSIQERGKESQAILDVFFGQAEVCIVTDAAFNTMKEMNPQVGRKLRIIAESPELISSIGFFRPDWPPDYKKRVIEGMRSDALKRHERGRQIMLLFNIEKIDLITDDQLESTRKLLADYDRLKRKK